MSSTCLYRRSFSVLTPSEAIHMESRALNEMREIILHRLSWTRTLSVTQREINLKKPPDTKNAKFYKSIFFINFDNSNQFEHSCGSHSMSRCRCFDWNSPDMHRMHPARVIIETPFATRIHRADVSIITPDSVISRDSRAFSAMRQIILHRLVCVRGL